MEHIPIELTFPEMDGGKIWTNATNIWW
jgi:hypothetical protein